MVTVNTKLRLWRTVYNSLVGNNTGTVNKQKLNSLVKVQGEGVTEAESAAFKSASGNINVKADGTDKLELQLAKDLKILIP